MYTEQDLHDVRLRIRRVTVIGAGISCLLIAGYVLTLIYRLFWPGYACIALECLVVIFLISEYLSPLVRYRRFLERAREGQGLPLCATITDIQRESCLRMGRKFVEVYCLEDGAEDARKLYLERRFADESLLGREATLRIQDHYILELTL